MKPLTLSACENASQRVYIVDGKAYEGFWLSGEFVFENGIRNTESFTRTHPGWVLNDNGYCQWAGKAPVRIPGLQNRYASNAASQTSVNPNGNSPLETTSNSAMAADSGGAFLLLLALVGAAGYAFHQSRNGRDDFAEDYHPMDDAPALPTVYTDDNLNAVYERTSYPQYQGVREPNPWQSNQVFPASRSPHYPHGSTTPPPHSTFIPPVDSTSFPTGGAGGGASVVDPKQRFEMNWLPAPAKGYFLDEESVLSNSSQAKTIVRDAFDAGISTNFLMTHVFRISKNTKKHELLKRLIAVVEAESNHA